MRVSDLLALQRMDRRFGPRGSQAPSCCRVYELNRTSETDPELATKQILPKPNGEYVYSTVEEMRKIYGEDYDGT